MVYLITGKSGAGKTHYAIKLVNELLSEGKKVHLIDGDEFRAISLNKDFTDLGRERNLREAAFHAFKWESFGYIVVCAFIAPKKEWRNMMRSYWKESQLVYIPGGSLWEGTTYEIPSEEELKSEEFSW